MKSLLLALALLVPVQQLDVDVRGAVQSFRHAHPGGDRPMQLATDIGRPVIVAGVLIVAAIAEGNLGAGSVRVALVAIAATNLVVEGLKRITYRARPDGEHRRSNASFPSGHASTACALAYALARRWRRWAVPLWAFAAWVSFSRIWLNRHWASDVLVGAAIGILCAWSAWHWLTPRARQEKPGEEPPPFGHGPPEGTPPGRRGPDARPA